jgi:hypothetical protein
MNIHLIKKGLDFQVVRKSACRFIVKIDREFIENE